MPTIEEVQEKARALLSEMGSDWLKNQLALDTTFKITSRESNDFLTTTLNYMLWRGWIETVPILTNTEGVISAWRLTREGQSLALTSLHGKPPPTPAPFGGKPC